MLEDLGSTNGSFVNSERLMAPRVLNPGDIVGFGENVTLSFDTTAPEAAATVAKPTEEPVPVAPAPAQKAPPPAAAPAAPAPAAEEEKSRSGWVIAGIGCLAIAIACIAIFALMDALYPDVLYAPLRLFGF